MFYSLHKLGEKSLFLILGFLCHITSLIV